MAYTIPKELVYPATFTAKDVIAEDETDLIAGQYTLIGEYVVKADEAVGIGRGALVAFNEAIGRLFAKFYDNGDTPAQITEGKFRIMLVSSQDIPITGRPVYLETDLVSLTTGETTPSERFVLPFEDQMLQKDRKFQFFIKVDSGVTLSKADSTVIMDMTRAML